MQAEAKFHIENLETEIKKLNARIEEAEELLKVRDLQIKGLEEELEDAEIWIDCLDTWGVDSWDGYEDAKSDYIERKGE